MKQTFIITIILGLFLMVSSRLEAKTTRETTYRYNQIWNSAVRFIRIDRGCKILEKDKDTGYVLFEYKHENTGSPIIASFELIETSRKNKKYLQFGMNIQAMPRYVEIMLVDKLLRKLKTDYGEPPASEQVVDKSKIEDEKNKAKTNSETQDDDSKKDEDDSKKQQGD